MTRGANIEYNLIKSPYRVYTDNACYVFSSKLHADKFQQRQSENREKISISLSNRFDIRINLNLLADILLYRKIEQRGFLIIANGVEYKCQNHIILGGEKLTHKKQEKQ